jgi:hypothetical protein
MASELPKSVYSDRHLAVKSVYLDRHWAVGSVYFDRHSTSLELSMWNLSVVSTPSGSADVLRSPSVCFLPSEVVVLQSNPFCRMDGGKNYFLTKN